VPEETKRLHPKSSGSCSPVRLPSVHVRCIHGVCRYSWDSILAVDSSSCRKNLRQIGESCTFTSLKSAPVLGDPMGDVEEDSDDVAHEMFLEQTEREEREYRYAHPHCTCQAELVWDETSRSWRCSTPTCPHSQFAQVDENVLRCGTCSSDTDVVVINSGKSSWDHVRKEICHSCLIDEYGNLIHIEASRVPYRSRESRGLPPLDDKERPSYD